MKLSKEAWEFFETWQREREKWACEKRIEGQNPFTEQISIDNIREACRLIDEYFLPTAIKIRKENLNL